MNDDATRGALLLAALAVGLWSSCGAGVVPSPRASSIVRGELRGLPRDALVRVRVGRDLIDIRGGAFTFPSALEESALAGLTFTHLPAGYGCVVANVSRPRVLIQCGQPSLSRFSLGSGVHDIDVRPGQTEYATWADEGKRTLTVSALSVRSSVSISGGAFQPGRVSRDVVVGASQNRIGVRVRFGSATRAYGITIYRRPKVASHTKLSLVPLSPRLYPLRTEEPTLSLRGAALALGIPRVMNRMSCCGAAEVFRSTDAQQWKALQPLIHVQPNTGLFGASVALLQNTLFVGVPGGDISFRQKYGHGEVNVYALRADNWIRKATLVSPNAQSWDWFGASLAASSAGGRVVVGAPSEDGEVTDDRLLDSGAVYVFRRDPDGWQAEARLVPQHPDLMERFGHSVAISGDTIVVGTPYQAGDPQSPDADLTSSGAAYVFQRRQGAWRQVARLKAPDAHEGDWFGEKVAVEGSTIAVGAPGCPGPSGPTEDGAVYLFTLVNDTWKFERRIASPTPEALKHYGSQVVMQGHNLVVGAPGGAVGSVHLYRDDTGRWQHVLQLDGSGYGRAIAIDGTRLVVFGKEGRAARVNIYGLILPQSKIEPASEE